MFNRVLLFLIAAASIVWIAYVGYDLLDQRDKITPQNIFGTEDGEILIINRTDEIDLAQLDFEVQPEIRPMLDKMLSSPYHLERLYISHNRAVILVELPYLWNRTVVGKFFDPRQITYQAADGEFLLGNGFRARYQRNFLLICKSEPGAARESLNWPVWDKKATASIIRLNQPLRSTDVYFKPDGTISYQTKYSRDIHSSKADDRDLFAEVLPSRLKNYHFYERKFALSAGALAEESPLYQWAETGFVLFDYNGKACIISDYASGQDPFVVIRERLSNTDTTQNTGNRFRNIRLTKSFPKDLSSGFYMMNIGDKIVISESKETCEQIVADYQIGKTVALTETARDAIYMKLPKKVSERYVTGRMAYTNTAYKNILIRTQLAKLRESEQQEETPVVVEDLNWTQPVDGETVQLLGRGNQQFIWTSTGKVISVSGKKRRWQITVEGKLINEPQLIDLQENGKAQILFNTASAIYLLDLNGKNIDGFPVKLNNEATNSVTYYRWKNSGNFLIVDDKNQLVQFDQKGRQTDVLKLNVGTCRNPVDVFNQKGNLIAVASGSERTQTINLTKFRIVKTHEAAISQDRVTVKGNEGPSYYSFRKGELQRQDYTGAEMTLANYPEPDQFRLIEGRNYKYIAFNSYNKIHVLNERGVKLFQFEIPFRELASFDVITLQNGKTYAAMIDGIENNLYLYDHTGRCYTEKPLEGKGTVLLSEKGSNNLVITTSGEGFVVQYFDVIKNAPKQRARAEEE